MRCATIASTNWPRGCKSVRSWLPFKTRAAPSPADCVLTMRSAGENANDRIIGPSSPGDPFLEDTHGADGDARADSTGVSTHLVAPLAIQASLSPVHLVEPGINVLTCLVLGIPVSLLKLALELLALTIDYVEVVIRKPAPLLLDLAFGLFPVS